MDWSAAHAGFVAGSYSITATVLVAMVLAVVIRDRGLARELRALESAAKSDER